MPTVGDRDALVADLAVARAAIDEALSHFPQETAARLGPAEAALARVREGLIARRRATPWSTGLRTMLDQINLALTLIVGVEYPQGAAKKPPLEQSQEILEHLLSEIAAWPPGSPTPQQPDVHSSDPPRSADQVSKSVGIRERIQNEARQGMDRRQMLNLAIGAGAVTAAGVVGVPVVATVLAPLFEPYEPNWQPIGPLEQFPTDSVEEARVAIPRDDWVESLREKLVFVWRRTADEVVVYSRNCTDVGCPLVFDRGSACFLCPCHGGIFLTDGTPIHGPPPRPMYRYSTRVRDGLLEIDLNSLPPTT